MVSGIQGGGFWAGFAAGSIASLASSLWQGDLKTETGFFKENNWAYGAKVTGQAGLGGGGTAGMIIFGSVMGGAGAALTGGNFWQGAVTGLIVSGLNHAMHSGPKDPPNKYKKFFQNKLSEIKQAYNANKVELRTRFDQLEILGGTMEIGGFVAAPFTAGGSLAIAAEGAKISASGTIGNMAMDAIEGKWESLAWRGVKFGAGLGMGRAIQHIPFTAGHIINTVKSFSETYIMPILEDSWNKFNPQSTPSNKLKL